MCGRYKFEQEPIKLQTRYKLNKLDIQVGLPIEATITPGAFAPVIIKANANSLQIMQWGITPAWLRDKKPTTRLFNTRAETILEKPTFRNAFLSRRCLIPATGFYEWKKELSKKIPYFLEMKDQSLFSFAGIYELSKEADDLEGMTFSIITTTPNPIIAPIHTRMPVILNERDEAVWLEKKSTTQILEKLLVPYQNATLISTPINT